MSEEDRGFLSRWSRRKIDARAGRPIEAEVPTAPPAESAVPSAAAPAAPAATPPEPLPSLESLTPHSDFSPFMRAEVDPALKGRALKTLFSDPALYPMDGLDVYIDDYSKPDPLPEGWLEKLNQFANLHPEPEAPAEAQPPVAPAAEAQATAPLVADEPRIAQAAAPSDTSNAPAQEPEEGNRASPER